MSAETSTAAGSDLSGKFEEGYDLLNRIDNEDLESRSQQYQDLLRKAIQTFEELTVAMNELQVFSRNESLEELATSDMKYLLLPAFLAYLTGKKCTPLPADRKDIVIMCNTYFRDFLKRLNEYQVVKVTLDPDDEDDEDGEGGAAAARLRSDVPSLESMASKRNDKISRFRRKKEHEEREKELRQRIEKGGTDDDEDVVREYYISLLKKWAIIALDELDGISLEKQMLRHMSREETQPSRHRHPQTKRQPLKPFIITKDAAMKQVFGLGYPSIPAMTVDEFVDQKNAEGTWAFSNKKIYDNSLQNWAEDPDAKKQEDEGYDERQERLDEEEDEQELQRKRNWDDFKDDVKRGEGNRKNMS